MHPLAALLPVVAGGTMLRRFCAGDVEPFHAYRSDAGLAVYQGWSAMSLDDARRFVSEMAAVAALPAGDWVQLAVADPASNALLGDLGLYLDPDAAAAEIGFTLSRSAQGRGHATRAVGMASAIAFAVTAVGSVRAVTDARNTGSIAVLERAGFTRTAVREVIFKGEPCTELVYVRARVAGAPHRHEDR